MARIGLEDPSEYYRGKIAAEIQKDIEKDLLKATANAPIDKDAAMLVVKQSLMNVLDRAQELGLLKPRKQKRKKNGPRRTRK